jgi:hypothetical protein
MPKKKKKQQTTSEPLAALIALVIVIALGVTAFNWVKGLIDPSSKSDSAASASPSAAPEPPKPPEAPPVTGYDEAAAAQGYPGDGAGQKAIAAWMGDWAARSGLPRELPVMAALVESNLVNADHGDRDSLGYFQMRTSVWLGQYPDYPTQPARQLAWFITQALKVKQLRERDGQDVVGDSSQWGQWAADVEQPQESYRGRYQERLPEARQLLG